MNISSLLSACLLFAALAYPTPPLPRPVPPVDPPPPPYPGKLVNVGGHLIHLNCIGSGSPTVVVEDGLGDVSTDWTFVQQRVSRFARICTYDRAGYAWSQPGPMPRTYAQLNFELHEALRVAGESAPYVLVGHSFGGPVIRNYALTYPNEVSGLVLVDTIHEDQRIPIGDKAVLLRASASGRPIPPARLDISLASDSQHRIPVSAAAVEPPLNKLPLALQEIHLWAEVQPSLDTAENSQREWSPESLAVFHDTPQLAIFGSRPLIVLSRAHGGYPGNLDVSAAALERERLLLQKRLAQLSTNSLFRILKCGHDMHLEAPASVASAIHSVVKAARAHSTVRL